ncbi:uncharacterized protein LOC128310227 isoform X1 [Anopheles moucheti]|uniref:uncharacterized protein LOC128310227 isoform X1 n=1 Tax=Anopheles moucheti TaxID=186751 RepID=UPI0022F04EB9|nr:uncharacterized protein LOC128310227 isoform X1 [Anopheles moucheti]
MVARAGRSRFFACLGLLIVMVGFVTMFHNSQQQLDELRQLGLRCEQQQKSVQAQMEVIVDQKLRLENSLESERMINEANRKELKQKAKEEKEEHSKTSMEANIRYASLQQQCNLVKSQLGDLTEECSRGRKQQSEEINSLRLKVSELQGKVQRYKQESANDAEHLKAQIVQLKSDKHNLEATLRQQLGEKDHVIEQMRDLATKMEKENAHYLEHCKLPAEQLPKQHHRYRDVLEALSRDDASKANAPVHNFNEQLSVSDDLYRIPVALRTRHFATPPGNLFGASFTTVSIGLSPSTFSPPFATNKRSSLGVGLPQASEEQEMRVIANPFEVVPRAVDAKRSERHSPETVPNTNPTIHPALDGGIINSVENFQIIPKPLPAEAAPEGAPANNVLQEPQLLKTSTSVSTGHKRSSDRNLQLPILAAPTVLPGPPSLEHSSKRTNNGADGGGGTLSGSSSSTTSTTTNASVRKAAGAAPNRSAGSAARKPLSNRHTKQVPVGIVPFPDIMPELEQNISENILDNRYANVAAAAAGGSTGVGRPIAEPGGGGGASSVGMSKKAFADKQRRHGSADLNFLNGGGANAADDNGAHEVQDTEMRAKRPAAIGADGERGADNGAPAEGDDDQLAMGNENNLNAAEEDTNLYDNANDAAAVGLGNKPQFGGGDRQHHLDYNDVMVPGHGIGRHIGSKRREGPAGAGGIDSKGVIIDRLGDKLINEIAHDHGKEGDNYPNEMEDLHLVGNEAEEEDVSDYDDPTALKQGHAERN